MASAAIYSHLSHSLHSLFSSSLHLPPPHLELTSPFLDHFLASPFLDSPRSSLATFLVCRLPQTFLVTVVYHLFFCGCGQSQPLDDPFLLFFLAIVANDDFRCSFSFFFFGNLLLPQPAASFGHCRLRHNYSSWFDPSLTQSLKTRTRYEALLRHRLGVVEPRH